MPHEIHSLSIHGDGIADGPIYAPFTLPGELIEGNLTGNRISTPRVLRPSQHRITAPCSHFKSCGGCAMQHASDAFVATWKVDVIKQALSAHGLTTDIRTVATSPPHSRRRATLAGKRTKNGAMVGFHTRASNVIIAIPNCTLLEPEIMAAIPALEALTVIGASRKAELSIAVNATHNGLDISVSNGKELDPSSLEKLAHLVEIHKFSRLTWNGDTIAARAPAALDIAGTFVIPPPGAFIQATEAGQKTLIKEVCNIVAGTNSVVDLFAGCGTFSLPQANIASVHAVEGDAQLLTALDAAWRQSSGLKPVTIEKRDLFRNPLLPDELDMHDAIIIDPPRAGAEAQSHMIAKCSVDTVAFVSCNPVTFARDARILSESGYVLNLVQPIDQFRWSSHVELVANFTRP